jgi:hypothetical protein
MRAFPGLKTRGRVAILRITDLQQQAGRTQLDRFACVLLQFMDEGAIYGLSPGAEFGQRSGILREMDGRQDSSGGPGGFATDPRVPFQDEHPERAFRKLEGAWLRLGSSAVLSCQWR